MPNTKTTDENPASNVADADLFRGVKGGLNVKFAFSQVKTWIKAWIVKSDVGLGSVDNTSDVNKPVSTAQAAAIAIASVYDTGITQAAYYKVGSAGGADATYRGHFISEAGAGMGSAAGGFELKVNSAGGYGYRLTSDFDGSSNFDFVIKSRQASAAWTNVFRITGAQAVVNIGIWRATAVEPVYGGTGLFSYTAGDLLYASATDVLGKLAAGAAGNVLLSGAAPSWGKVGLTTHVGGLLPIVSGGTNSGSASGTSLDNITGFSSTGFLARTGSGTYDFRDVTGTANEITVANGNGISGAPTISLPAALTFTGKTINGGTFAGPAAITGLPDPSDAQDAATKAYVDSLAAGLDVKPSVICATTANITLSGEQTLDGILTSASRVLVKDQSTASQNGIYVSAAGAWARATDMDAWAEVPGAMVFVDTGTLYGDTAWVSTANAGGTLGVTSITWSQFSGAGTYSATGGVTLTGTQFSITANGITNAMLRQGAALTVVGRSANSTGDVADIAAASDHQVFRRSGAELGFGAVDLSQSAAVTGTLPVGSGGTGAATLTGLLQGNGTSAFTVVSNSSTIGQVLRVTGANAYAWGALDLADTDAITGDLPFSNMAQGSALSVLGVTGNATADHASIAAASDHQVMRRSGTAVAFGALNLAQSAAVTGVLPIVSGGSGTTVGPVVTVKKQMFTASGTYTPSAGMLYAMIECVGGGGGGGGATGTAGHVYAGGGGGAGSYSRILSIAATVGASQTVTVGTGGAGGAAGSNVGVAGNDTSVGAICVGKGGGAASFGSSTTVGAAGAGGVVGTGDITAVGNAGTAGIFCQAGDSVLTGGGIGGGSAFGGAGRGGIAGLAPSSGSGQAGAQYGGGGGGGIVSGAGSAAAGGAGGAGVVYITEYCNQ